MHSWRRSSVDSKEGSQISHMVSFPRHINAGGTHPSFWSHPLLVRGHRQRWDAHIIEYSLWIHAAWALLTLASLCISPLWIGALEAYGSAHSCLQLKSGRVHAHGLPSPPLPASWDLFHNSYKGSVQFRGKLKVEMHEQWAHLRFITRALQPHSTRIDKDEQYL